MNILFIATLVFIILQPIAFYFIFKKAGYQGWKSLIPIYNLYIWSKIINISPWFLLLLIIPNAGMFLICVYLIYLNYAFGKNKKRYHLFSILFPFIYIPYLAFSKKIKFLKKEERNPQKTPVAWVIIFGVLFVIMSSLFIRTFCFEAYDIPTSAMEKSLLVGDYLFVDKISFGPRFPMTPLSFPFAHHTLPMTKFTKSYLEWIKLPYYRFPGFTKIKNNDVVVFNDPYGDTVALNMPNQNYYNLVRNFGRREVWKDKRKFGDIVARPVDKRENYIKRCIGIPGDMLEIKDQVVYINGKALPDVGKKEYNYMVQTDSSAINPRIFDKLDITEYVTQIDYDKYIMTLTSEAFDGIKKLNYVRNLEKIVYPKGEWHEYTFPFDSNYRWNEDNYGPLYIPKAGSTIPINSTNISLYKRCIEIYENNDVKIKGDKVLINGKEATSYTFKLGYYWMMGDNRHNSADSRFWGFVPIDHIVGRAVFVWLSVERQVCDNQQLNSIRGKQSFFERLRWKKMFRLII